MNYEALLKKYIKHVGDVEGATFIFAIGSHLSDVEFTDEEKKVLEAIDEGIWK